MSYSYVLLPIARLSRITSVPTLPLRHFRPCVLIFKPTTNLRILALGPALCYDTSQIELLEISF